MTTLNIVKPADSAEVRLVIDKNVTEISFGFNLDQTIFEKIGNTLCIHFNTGEVIYLEGFYSSYNADSMPTFLFENVSINGYDFFASFEPDLMPAAGLQEEQTTIDGFIQTLETPEQSEGEKSLGVDENFEDVHGQTNVRTKHFLEGGSSYNDSADYDGLYTGVMHGEIWETGEEQVNLTSAQSYSYAGSYEIIQASMNESYGYGAWGDGELTEFIKNNFGNIAEPDYDESEFIIFDDYSTNASMYSLHNLDMINDNSEILLGGRGSSSSLDGESDDFYETLESFASGSNDTMFDFDIDEVDNVDIASIKDAEMQILAKDTGIDNEMHSLIAALNEEKGNSQEVTLAQANFSQAQIDEINNGDYNDIVIGTL